MPSAFHFVVAVWIVASVLVVFLDEEGWRLPILESNISAKGSAIYVQVFRRLKSQLERKGVFQVLFRLVELFGSYAFTEHVVFFD